MAKNETTFELRIACDEKDLVFAAAKQLGVSGREIVRNGALIYARSVCASTCEDADG